MTQICILSTLKSCHELCILKHIRVSAADLLSRSVCAWPEFAAKVTLLKAWEFLIQVFQVTWLKWNPRVTGVHMQNTSSTGPGCNYGWFHCLMQSLRCDLAGCWPGVRSRLRATEALTWPTSPLPGGTAWPSALSYTARGLSSCKNTHRLFSEHVGMFGYSGLGSFLESPVQTGFVCTERLNEWMG